MKKLRPCTGLYFSSFVRDVIGNLTGNWTGRLPTAWLACHERPNAFVFHIAPQSSFIKYLGFIVDLRLSNMTSAAPVAKIF